jgi:methionine synthase II (cobalamin-independent)
MLHIEFNNRVEEKAQKNWGAVTDYTRHYLYEKYNDLYMSDEYETQEEAANAAAKELNQICKRVKNNQFENVHDVATLLNEAIQNTQDYPKVVFQRALSGMVENFDSAAPEEEARVFYTLHLYAESIKKEQELRKQYGLNFVQNADYYAEKLGDDFIEAASRTYFVDWRCAEYLVNYIHERIVKAN